MCSRWMRQRCFHVSTLRNSIRLCRSVHACVCAYVLTYAHTHTHSLQVIFFSFLSTNLWSSHLLPPSRPLPCLLQPITLPYHQEVQENETNVIFFLNSNLCFSLQCKKRRHEVKTDVEVCSRHTRSSLGDAHSSAEPRHQHSPSIRPPR